jgi:hypothetical protein
MLDRHFAALNAGDADALAQTLQFTRLPRRRHGNRPLSPSVGDVLHTSLSARARSPSPARGDRVVAGNFFQP